MTRETCEIADCSSLALATVNGISVCERCRIHFVSVGFGAVHFGGRWHGVQGAKYTAEQCAVYPGLAAAPEGG